MPSIKELGIACAGLTLFANGAAQAYVGPGAGLTAIGTVIALFGAILLALVGFVWYPLKRLLARKKSSDTAEESSESGASMEAREKPPAADDPEPR